jgi:hypothetical protein
MESPSITLSAGSLCLRIGNQASKAERDTRGLLSFVEGLLLQLARRDIDPAETFTVIARFVAVVFAH